MAIDEIEFNTWAAKQHNVAINYAERRFFSHINSLAKDLKYLLADVSRIDNMPKDKIDNLIQQAVAIQNTRYADAIDGFTNDAARLAEYAAASEKLGLAMKVKAKDVAVIARRTPIAANGLLFSEHMDTLLDYNNRRLTKVIREGWASNIEVDDLSALIIGTEKVKLADGLMYKQKVSARAAIDTAAHHHAMVGKGETWKANDVYKYRIVATLDTSTTPICQDLDGQEFEYNSAGARVPPFHYFCRTVIVPVIDPAYSFLSEGRTRASMYGSVDANINYKEWAEINKDKIAADKERERLLRNKRQRRKRARAKANE